MSLRYPLRRRFVAVALLAPAVARADAARRRPRASRPAGPTSAKTADESATSVADPGELAFEQGRWQDAIDEYRKLLAASPDDRLSLLRIAQAQRELRNATTTRSRRSSRRARRTRPRR